MKEVANYYQCWLSTDQIGIYLVSKSKLQWLQKLSDDTVQKAFQDA